jgi:hypothetical protein
MNNKNKYLGGRFKMMVKPTVAELLKKAKNKRGIKWIIIIVIIK